MPSGCRRGRHELARIEPWFQTEIGDLYHGDCRTVLRALDAKGSGFHTIFADPPFNLGKEYGARVDDTKSVVEYERWTREWLDACLPVMFNGASIFVYNLPRWCVFSASHLMERGLHFVDWIAVKQTQSPPRKNGLYRAHYGCVHLSKGKPLIERKLRMPIETCRHCDGEIRDYGGHRKAMRDDSVNISDIWTDISSVRHKKFKVAGFDGPQLSTKLLQRILLLTTYVGDVVLDPFGGSGTTAAVCERMDRDWVSIEIEERSCEAIRRRLVDAPVCFHKSEDVVVEVR